MGKPLFTPMPANLDGLPVRGIQARDDQGDSWDAKLYNYQLYQANRLEEMTMTVQQLANFVANGRAACRKFETTGKLPAPSREEGIKRYLKFIELGAFQTEDAEKHLKKAGFATSEYRVVYPSPTQLKNMKIISTSCKSLSSSSKRQTPTNTTGDIAASPATVTTAASSAQEYKTPKKAQPPVSASRTTSTKTKTATKHTKVAPVPRPSNLNGLLIGVEEERRHEKEWNNQFYHWQLDLLGRLDLEPKMMERFQTWKKRQMKLARNLENGSKGNNIMLDRYAKMMEIGVISHDDAHKLPLDLQADLEEILTVEDQLTPENIAQGLVAGERVTWTAIKPEGAPDDDNDEQEEEEEEENDDEQEDGDDNDNRKKEVEEKVTTTGRRNRADVSKGEENAMNGTGEGERPVKRRRVMESDEDREAQRTWLQWGADVFKYAFGF